MIRSLLLVALALTACGPSRPEGPPPEYPGRLVSSDAVRSPLGEGFVLEQRIRSESPADEAREFRAVLQLDGGVITLVGLGPHGGRAFVLTQRGDELDWESNLPGELPFPPDFMLHDAQRAWFRGLEGPLADGEHEGEVEDEHVTEVWEGGRLRERVFTREDRPDQTLTVRYEGGMAPGEPPVSAVIENGWFGYQLTVTTLSFEAFEPEAAEPETAGGDAPAADEPSEDEPTENEPTAPTEGERVAPS